MRAASVFYRGMFNFTVFTLPQIVYTKEDIDNNDQIHQNIKSLMKSEDLICNEIFMNDQTYKKGDLVIINITDCDSLTVGIILAVLVRGNEIHFVLQQYRAIRNILNYFDSGKAFKLRVYLMLLS